MEFLKFENGDKMPALGLGTWKSAKGEVYKAVREAINIGYRHFDCALLYGNEDEIGEALNVAQLDHEVKREELWITSKLWNNAHKHEHILPNIKTSLRNLKLEYLDLYLIHWPVALRPDVIFPAKGEDLASLKDVSLTETWKGMIELKEMGLTKHIGVSNFSIKKINALISETGVKPEMNQVEMHPYFQQTELLDFCNGNGILMTAYAPLGSTDRPENRKTIGEPLLFDDETIKAIALRNNISPAQVMLAWAVTRGTSPIPKSVHYQRLKDNLAAGDIKLSDSDINEINNLNKNYRYIKGDFWCLPGSDYTLQNLWDE
jgi:alcohol dehydrogenase (NADP+)